MASLAPVHARGLPVKLPPEFNNCEYNAKRNKSMPQFSSSLLSWAYSCADRFGKTGGENGFLNCKHHLDFIMDIDDCGKEM